MRIMKNEAILQRQSENYIKGELSNVALITQTPQIMVEYFAIDANMSTTMDGLKIVEEFIGKNSPVVFDYIDNLPMTGIDNLVMQSQFEEEIGFEVNFTSSAIMFPNMQQPKPNDFFVIKGSQVKALYVVTSVEPTVSRSNPFIAIQFALYSQSADLIAQLRSQVRERYLTTVTAIGLDKSLIVKEESYFAIQDHVRQYLELVDLYVMLFYDGKKGAFSYDELLDPKTLMRLSFIDMTIWKFMFDSHVIIFDEIVTYANNNYQDTVDRVYTGCPDIFIEEFDFKQSIIYQLFKRDKRRDFSEYRYPLQYDASTQMTKFQGHNIYYLEKYLNTPDNGRFTETFFVWDDDFIARIKSGTLYDIPKVPDPNANPHTTPNYYIRNVIINWYNDKPITWEEIEIIPNKTIENFTLIPILVAIYKTYIQNLQK